MNCFPVVFHKIINNSTNTKLNFHVWTSKISFPELIRYKEKYRNHFFDYVRAKKCNDENCQVSNIRANDLAHYVRNLKTENTQWWVDNGSYSTDDVFVQWHQFAVIDLIVFSVILPFYIFSRCLHFAKLLGIYTD